MNIPIYLRNEQNYLLIKLDIFLSKHGSHFIIIIQAYYLTYTIFMVYSNFSFVIIDYFYRCIKTQL